MYTPSLSAAHPTPTRRTRLYVWRSTMNDRALVVAALIIGGAIVASSFQTRQRYALSAATNNVAWRMDTWSGQIDICMAAYLPNGPLVRCGVSVVVPEQPPQSGQQPQESQQSDETTPLPSGDPL